MAETREEYLKRQDARVDETFDVHSALADDLEQLSDQSNQNHQGARRAYVRGAFALIEAMTYRMKGSALEIDEGKLTPGEVQLLEERDFGLKDSGEVHEKNAKLRTLPNLRFTVSMLAKASGIEWRPDYQSNGWQAVKSAIVTRDRLMHPRTLADLQVSDEQLKQAVDAVAWFTSVLVKAFAVTHEKQAKDAGREHVPLAFMEKFKDIIADSLGEKPSSGGQ